MHASRQIRQRSLQLYAALNAFQPQIEASEFRHAIAPLFALQRQVLLQQRVARRYLVTVEKIGEAAVTLGGVANDRGGLPVARTVSELLERRVDPIVLR